MMNLVTLCADDIFASLTGDRTFLNGFVTFITKANGCASSSITPIKTSLAKLSVSA